MKQKRIQIIAVATCLLAAHAANAQTQIDLRTQSKSVDFSASPSTKPSKTGATVPASCGVGETFFKTNATAGQNLYGCTSTNTWTVLGSATSGVSAFNGLLDCQVTRTSATVLTVFAPCNFRVGNAVTSYSFSATVTISGSGSGVARIGLDSAAGVPNLKVFNGGLTVACAGMSCNNVAGSAFDAETVPLASWSASSGSWDTNGGTDLRPVLSTTRILPGSGLQDVTSGGTKTISIDAAVVPTYLTSTATLDFPSINSGACASELTIALAGAATGDSVAPGWPSGLEAGLLGTMRVSAGNVVSVRVCNLSGSALDPASAVFRATIVRSF
ncbi:MAG: hypothetical protein ABIZ80_14610 [Bryobacteraceae bacterium]